MIGYRSNKGLEFIKDSLKSYVYVKEKGKDVGLFCWDYNKKKWKYFGIYGGYKAVEGECESD